MIRNVKVLKLINPYFQYAWDKYKKAELRYNDRDYAVGDILYLQEYHPTIPMNRFLVVEVTNVIEAPEDPTLDLGLKEGWVMLSFEELSRGTYLTTPRRLSK